MTDSLILQELGTDIDVFRFNLLLKAPVIPEKTEAGIFTTESYRKSESRAPNVGLVLKIGPQAFTPPEKFGIKEGETLCKIGDWVKYSHYERDEEYINGHLCYFIVDDRIIAKYPSLDVAMKKSNS